MTAMERLSSQLEGAPQALLEGLLLDAEGMILAATGRSALPGALETAKVQLAVVFYNRRGAEGQTTHSEGGVSRTFAPMPEDIRRQIAPYRLARIVKVSADETA